MYRDDSLTLHTDAYQINMIYTYWQQGIDQTPVVFEAYFRIVTIRSKPAKIT